MAAQPRPAPLRPHPGQQLVSGGASTCAEHWGAACWLHAAAHCPPTFSLPLPVSHCSGRAFNTGIFAARNTPGARAFLAAWADMLTDPEKERHTDPARRGIDDQMAANLLLQEGDIVAASDGEWLGLGRLGWRLWFGSLGGVCAACSQRRALADGSPSSSPAPLRVPGAPPLQTSRGSRWRGTAG